MKYFYFSLFIIGLLGLSSCGDDDQFDTAAQLETDIELIQGYLTDNNLTAQSTASGLHYIIEEEGTGDNPSVDELVIFEFSGSYIDGSDFGSSIGAQVFDLNSIVDGFKEGIPLFKIGGKGKLLIPSGLAFGPEGAGSVPPNSILIFDIVLPDLCVDESDFEPKQLCLDIYKIETYLADSNLVAQSTASGLHYIIEVEGTGDHPTLTDVVRVHYKGYFTNGTVFDETTANAIAFKLGDVIEGWQEGIQLFKKGGKGKLFVPSGLAYGSNPPAGIPANTVLIFDVELVDF